MRIPKKLILWFLGLCGSFAILVHMFTYGWVPSAASFYVADVVDMYFENKVREGSILNYKVIPLDNNYTECRPWIFENAWSDCMAVYVYAETGANLWDELRNAIGCANKNVNEAMASKVKTRRRDMEHYKKIKYFFSTNLFGCPQNRISLYTSKDLDGSYFSLGVFDVSECTCRD